MPQLLTQYAAHHPDVKIDLEDALSEQAVRALTIGTAEVAIIGDNTPTDGLETLVADVDNLVLIAPAAHSLAGSTSVAFDRTLNHNFVTLARSASLTRKVSAAAEAAGRILRMTVQVRSFDATLVKWVALARTSAWKDFEEKNESCAKLLKLAEKVPA